tara:strand:- start:5295 stop:7673 length:2379 start_codon:yes stop_codon:yes gene_type:complete
MNQESNINNEANVESNVDLRGLFEYYFHFWPWFLLGLIISISIAFLNIRYSTFQYEATTSIMIKDNAKSGVSKELEAFKDLGIIGGNSSNNIINEIEIITSRKIVRKVVEKLNLNISYYTSSTIKETEAYTDSPIFLTFTKNKKDIYNYSNIFFIKLKENDTYDLIDFNDELISSYSFGEEVEYFGVFFKIKKNLFSTNKRKDIRVVINSAGEITSSYQARISISEINKQSSVLKISLTDPVQNKAKDFLNELINQYNLDAINDKNIISEKTKQFIDDRLKKVKEELNILDNNVKQFKENNDFSGIPEEISITFKTLQETNQQINITKTKLSFVEWIEDLLTQESTTGQLLPLSVGFEDSGLSSAIDKYNELLLLREKTGLDAGPENPVINEIDSQIVSFTSSLLKSLTNIKKALEIQLNILNDESEKIFSLVRSIPNTERGFIDIARQQEIIGSLYKYLLKKKEETDISLAITVSNAKIIDFAYGSGVPISPKKNQIYMFALIFGFFVPFSIIYLLEMFDTKINNRIDLEKGLQNISILGEVPFDENLKDGQNNIRGITAESTRVLRSSISFLLKKEKANTIVVTSTTKGEGKSFISFNLALSYSALGKKVILVGADLRNPQLHNRIGIKRDTQGLSTYLSNENFNDLNTLITRGSGPKEMDYLLSGAIPPNPSELLMRPRMKELLERLKEQYDVILIDSAPLLLVSDTTSLLPLSDLVVYVSRAQFSDKNIFPFIKDLQNRPNIPPFGMVLNGLIAAPRSGYNYKYGYRYSYTYKYNYGYGYGYEADKDS